MGYLYRPKLRSGNPGRIWWVKYYVNGRPIRESTGQEKQEKARDFLKLREGAVAKGMPVAPRLDRILYDEVAADLRQHYRTTGCRDLDEAEDRLAHLDRFFRNRRASAITAPLVTAYVAERQSQKTHLGRLTSNRTVNIELALLKRMLRLAYENGKLLRVPPIKMLKEAPPRQGFFGEIEFLAAQNALPEYLRGPAAFAYITGWRKQEVLGLTWDRVDLRAGTVRLHPEPGSTKKRDGRTVVLPEPLHEVLTGLWQERQSIATPSEIMAHVPWVFLRGGQRIKDFRRAWNSARKKAKAPTRLFHDFRRTAVRNMTRAGIPDVVAMRISGHKTRSIFDRYNIVSEDDLREAARKLTGTFSGISGQIPVDPSAVSVEN